MIKENPRFLQKKTKNLLRLFFVNNKNVTRIKLGPETYQLFLLPRE